MHIYLQATLPNGELADVGQYGTDVAPRVNEKILLWLHDGYRSVVDAFDVPQVSAKFRVISVTHSAYNWLATEEWMRPFDTPSSSLHVEVSPDDDKAKMYLKRLAEKMNERMKE